MILRLFAFIGALVSLGAPALASAEPRALAAAPAATGEARCKAMIGDYGAIQDAPSHVTASAWVAATSELPTFCQVQGYIQPNTGFELRLPAAWNGKYFQVGCGGFCGVIFTSNCDDALRRGYACIATDMGHRSTPTDGKWAYNNLQAEVDYGFRSTHVAALAGKSITRTYYGRAPSKSYFQGGSTGGRQALILAQDFPYDFDGIIGGVPPIEQQGNGYTLAWNALAIMGPDKLPVVSEAEMMVVHEAVLAMCDMDDGVKDRVLSDPLACAFEPKQLLCKGRKTDSCLTAIQVEAVRKIYQGPVNAKGEKLYTSGSLKGSEPAWVEAYGRTATHDHYYGMVEQGFAYMGLNPDPGPTYSLTDFDWNEDYKRVGVAERLYKADNPDLRKFKAAGGKFIFWQGWADQAVMPEKSIDYYNMVERVMGGREQTQDFFRLFMIAGAYHSLFYPGATTIDHISALEAWVEKGQPPEYLVGVHVKSGSTYSPKYPLEPSNIAFSRRFYPYPYMGKYTGSGDPNDAANFAPVPLRGTFDSQTKSVVVR
jgi:hypothetical protein